MTQAIIDLAEHLGIAVHNDTIAGMKGARQLQEAEADLMKAHASN
ncbi:MAG: hypothetical protein Q8M26_02895 [Pseudolabrys sp.]|nr:hypothetical protein [Pseudolabrys sp.]